MTTNAAQASPLATYFPFIVLLGMSLLMYLLILRPQRKKEKETEEMRKNLQVGDEIVTIGGFYGRVVKIKGENLIIQCGADRTKLEIANWAVSTVVNKSSAPAASVSAAEAEEEVSRKPSPKSIKKLGKSSDDETAE
ncbi:MAG: preprotein translocase subunit YajC [Firmicutes bacterium]|nr:preprotein translocase subunit YajC [Bacillota bacterium]